MHAKEKLLLQHNFWGLARDLARSKEIYKSLLISSLFKVGSIPVCVRMKVLMFGLLDAQKFHIFAARDCSMLKFDAQ